MRIFRLSLFLSLFFSLNANAQNIVAGCGISLLTSKNIHIQLHADQGEKCSSRIDIAPDFPLLEDSKYLLVENIPVKEKLKSSAFSKNSNGKYRFKKPDPILEEQYSIISVDGGEVFSKNLKQKLIVGSSFKLRVAFNPYMLWPDESQRKKKIEKYNIQKNGLIFECLLAYVGNDKKTVSLSACLPQSRNKNPYFKELISIVNSVELID